MLIKKFENVEEITAGDNCKLRELLNPNVDDVESRYSVAWAKVEPGQKTLPHAMETTEVYVILRGVAKMYIEDEVEDVGVMDTIYIPPKAKQSIENIGKEDLEFLCMVDPAWRAEDESLSE